MSNSLDLKKKIKSCGKREPRPISMYAILANQQSGHDALRGTSPIPQRRSALHDPPVFCCCSLVTRTTLPLSLLSVLSFLTLVKFSLSSGTGSPDPLQSVVWIPVYTASWSSGKRPYPVPLLPAFFILSAHLSIYFTNPLFCILCSKATYCSDIWNTFYLFKFHESLG